MKMTKYLPLLTLPLLLVGCASGNPLEVRRTSCPALSVPTHTGTLTRFSQAGRFDAQDVQLVATISGLNDNCTENDSGVNSVVSFNITVSRPDKGPAQSVQLPYFITVVKDGETIIAKQIYDASLNFADGAMAGTINQAVTVKTPDVPLPPMPKKNTEIDEFAPPPKPAMYEILVGFQLSEADAVYNISK